MPDRYPVPTGKHAARLHGARMTLIEWAATAIAKAALAQSEGEVEFAASLRGKARGYTEAAEVLRALERQGRIPRRWRGWRKNPSSRTSAELKVIADLLPESSRRRFGIQRDTT